MSSSAAVRAAYRAEHREEIAAYNAAWRSAHPDYGTTYQFVYRDELAAGHRAYYAAHREEILAQKIVYRASRRSEKRIYNAAHYLTHPEAHQRADAKRRGATMCEHAACLSLGATQLAWQTNEHVCYLCGTPVWRGVNLHMDHVYPISKGGLHCAENLRPTCAPCNRSKYTKVAS